MNPYSRTTWTLVAALVMWIPIAFGVVGGGADFAMAGAYFLGALFISYVGTGIISSMSHGYRHGTETKFVEARRQIEEIERRKAEGPKRRKTDSPEGESAAAEEGN